ncbi:MAG: hypothetical protein OEV76_03325, partial [Anaerolineae bacterium]|nr:hypothetical protein [Anaerolineae bacterium]
MATPSGGQSRLFRIVVVGLVGLLMIGLVSIAGLVVYSRFLAPGASPTVVAETTATTVATATSRPTRVASPTSAVPTATKVVQEGTPAPEGPTPSPKAPTATPQGGGQMAPTGF